MDRAAGAPLPPGVFGSMAYPPRVCRPARHSVLTQQSPRSSTEADLAVDHDASAKDCLRSIGRRPLRESTKLRCLTSSRATTRRTARRSSTHTS